MSGELVDVAWNDLSRVRNRLSNENLYVDDKINKNLYNYFNFSNLKG